MSDYFLNLGKAISQELCRNPSTREKVRKLANQSLTSHLKKPNMARDAMPTSFRTKPAKDDSIDPDLVPRGGEGYGNGGEEAPVDPDQLITFVRMLLARLDGSAKEAFLSQLSDLFNEDATDDGTLQITNSGNGNSSGYSKGNNPGALDRGRRSARDTETTQAIPTASRYSQTAQDRRRLAAQDSAISTLNHKGFEARWGKLTSGVDNWGRR